MLPTGPAGFIISHPGHELRVYGWEEVIDTYRQNGRTDPRLDLQAAALYLAALDLKQVEAPVSPHPTRALLRRLYRASRRLPGLRRLVRLPAVERLIHTTRWKLKP